MKNEEKAYLSPSINFADADVVDKDTIRLFRDYSDRRFLVGYLKSGRKPWVKKHNLYTVRVEDAIRKGSVDINNPLTFAVDYIILYENRNRNHYHIYKASDPKLYKREEIEQQLGYKKPLCDYLVFKLGVKVRFEDVELIQLLDNLQTDNKRSPVYTSGWTIYNFYRKNSKRVGLVDADLLDNGTRHPNLALLKIAGYLYDNNVSFDLILDTNADISQYAHIFMSKVFTFTKEPNFYLNATPSQLKKFHIGGTGYYANEKSVSKFRAKREEDMDRLGKDPYLLKLVCKRSGKNGINMAMQMPYYHLYDEFVEKQVKLGFKREKYKDYTDYSIGFITRKCYRHCPFCVNKLEDEVGPYSKLDWFYDRTRPHVYFWDDNFLAAPYQLWKSELQYLIDNKISFQFRQGLDERQLAESEHGEEMAQMLSKSRYHGDFIFAFDNWRDRDLIERALKIWKRYNPKKGTKFYLFCGFMQAQDKQDKFYRDIWEIFQRIKVLMSYGCVGYVMRHEDYKQAPIPNLYIQIARWCNQQAFYKKMSFWEFCYRNQSYWEETSLHRTNRPQLMSFEDFMRDVDAGFYGDEEGQTKMCLPLKSIMKILEMFPEHREELIEMFNYKMENLIDPHLWEDAE